MKKLQIRLLEQFAAEKKEKERRDSEIITAQSLAVDVLSFAGEHAAAISAEAHGNQVTVRRIATPDGLTIKCVADANSIRFEVEHALNDERKYDEDELRDLLIDFIKQSRAPRG